MNVTEAIAELKELSTQIDAVTVADRDGEVLGSTLDAQAAAAAAAAARALAEGADQVRRDLGREALSQLQAATPDGSVFLVVDAHRMAVATTGADPTVGLVFYDLKTLLRQTGDEVGDEEAAEAEGADG